MVTYGYWRARLLQLIDVWEGGKGCLLKGPRLRAQCSAAWVSQEWEG